jgi:hypothetical protein
MLHTDTAPIECPYCGERFDVVVDLSVAEQSYVEDCYVCCRPMVLAVSVDEDGQTTLRAWREDD